MARQTGTPRTVVNDGVALACLDHGGSGPDLVLLHGAGMSKRSMQALAGHLTSRFRVVTFDLRGHGETPMAPWTTDTAVSDVAAVAAAYGMTAPAVGGHSLGGMIAVNYARRHPECRAVINIDGQGTGSPEQYLGKDPELVAAWIRTTQARAAELTKSKPVRLLRFVGRLLGNPPPHPDAVAAILALTEGRDLMTAYREVSAPLLVINATAPSTGLLVRLMKGDPEGYVASYRLGISRDVSALAQERPGVELAEIHATHMLIRTHPEETARVVADFLGRHLVAA